jgi:6-phosphogluconolactonase
MRGAAPAVRVADNPEAAALMAADAVLATIRDAVAERGHATLALSGGTTPALLYQRLAVLGATAAPWDRVHFFFGDERCVAPDSPHSNFSLAHRELLGPLGIASSAVERMEGERRPIAAAAEAYEARLHQQFESGETTFDLVLLGMGSDGHTASLFAGSGALDEATRWVVPVTAPAGYDPSERITLTLPVIALARTVFFLVTGAGKRATVRSALTSPSPKHELPAGRVRPTGSLVWFLDAAAAGSATNG